MSACTHTMKNNGTVICYGTKVELVDCTQLSYGNERWSYVYMMIMEVIILAGMLTNLNTMASDRQMLSYNLFNMTLVLEITLNVKHSIFCYKYITTLH